MATIPLPTLRAWIKALKPEELRDPKDERYLDLDRESVRGTDGSCREALAYGVMLHESEERSCQLFSGYPGTGKSTELHRLAPTLLAQDPQSTVVMIDAEEYLDRYTAPSITDILRLMAWHLDREATRAEGGDPDKSPGYHQRIWRWLQSDVQIKEIGFEAYGAGLMAEIKDNPDFRERVEEVLRLRFQEFAREAHEVIHSAIRRIRAARRRSRVVVVVDGLEKFTAVASDGQGRMEEAVEKVFCDHASWLRINAHVIYTFPLWLRFMRPDLGGLYDTAPLVLPMVKVTRKDGTPNDAGIESLIHLVFKRVDEVERVFGPDPAAALRPLVLASGGYLRDLLRLVRDVLQRARSFPVGSGVVDEAMHALGEEYNLAAMSSDLSILEFVARHQFLPEGIARVRVAARLFSLVQVLTYRNGEEWYRLHPLVHRSKILQQRLLVGPAPTPALTVGAAKAEE